MNITEKLLLKYGFEKKCSMFGSFYVKGKVGIVQGVKWLPCNIDTGEPINTCSYVDTIEELIKLAKEADLSI